jgi:hypothetical protein
MNGVDTEGRSSVPVRAEGQEENMPTYELPMTLRVRADDPLEASAIAVVVEELRDDFENLFDPPGRVLWLHASLSPELLEAVRERMPAHLFDIVEVEDEDGGGNR